MRMFFLLFVGSLTLVASENPRELVRKAIENYQRDAQAALRYTYRTTDTNPKGTEVTQVIPINGTHYERLIAKNGRPLTPDEEKNQQEKYDEAVRKRASESPEEHAKRISKHKEKSSFLRDVPDAFDFTMLPPEAIDGRLAYVIQCVPKPDYQPRDTKCKMFSKLNAKIWIDKEDLRMAKAEAKIVDTMSFGWIMARIGKGGHIELTQKRVAEDVWLPKTIDINGSARILLVDDKRVDEQILFDGFKRVARLPTELSAAIR
jgi:hypothetical protein